MKNYKFVCFKDKTKLNRNIYKYIEWRHPQSLQNDDVLTSFL